MILYSQLIHYVPEINSTHLYTYHCERKVIKRVRTRWSLGEIKQRTLACTVIDLESEQDKKKQFSNELFTNHFIGY